MAKTFQILFAGAGGCGKSPVANHLSWRFNLPRMENDALRNEVKGDLMGELSNPLIKEECFRRLKERYVELNKLGWSFIDDCSIDRTWVTKDEWYDPKRVPFIISFDLSYEFIEKRYATHKTHQLHQLQRWVDDHDKFLESYGDQVNVRITEHNYADRIAICEDEVRKFINTL
jgi:adenylate kinase family enzyme